MGKMELLLSKPILGKTALGNLLDQMNSPCIIWDSMHDKIIQVNSELISITAFSREELYEVKAGDLINNFDLAYTANGNKAFELNRKNKLPLNCLIDSAALNGQGSLVLLTFRSVNGNNKNIADKNVFLKNVSDLVLLQENKPIDEYLDNVVDKLNSIYDCFSITIYLTDDPSEKLKKRKTTEPTSILPDEIPLSEISIIGNNDIWKPGKRVLTDNHRVARGNDLSLMIQISLSIYEEFKGLIVICSKNELDTEKTFEQLPLFVSIIGANLEKKYKEKKIKQKSFEKNIRALILDTILSNIKMGVVVINREGRITETNSFLEQLLGFSKWEIINNNAQAILPLSLLAEKNSQNKLQASNNINLVVNINRRDGSEFPAQIQFLPLSFSNEDGEDTINLLIINDLSQIDFLKMKNKQLERQAEMGVLVASFTHDVRNVFNSIKLNAETVEVKTSADQLVQEYTANIKEDCDRINQLMESVLSFSSSIEENIQSLDITFLLQRIIERWNPKLEKAKIKSILQFEKEIPHISADPRSLEQVFNNLFSNARDAMNQKGGTLGIYVGKKVQGDGLTCVVIKISDNGMGIPEEFISKIFDPYFSSRPGGTGLGLAITKRIVELHHGQIDVESFPGGTTFTVTLPEINHGESN